MVVSSTSILSKLTVDITLNPKKAHVLPVRNVRENKAKKPRASPVAKGGSDLMSFQTQFIRKYDLNGSRSRLVDHAPKFRTNVRESLTSSIKSEKKQSTVSGKKRVSDKTRDRVRLKSREMVWKPQNTIGRFDSKTSIAIGDPKGRTGYFRAFASSFQVPVKASTEERKESERVYRLLPHKMKKTLRLYGVSPLVLLRSTQRRISINSKQSSMKSLERKITSLKIGNKPKQETKKLKADRSNERLRIDGPEIAPNFGEANEFEMPNDTQPAETEHI